MPNWCENCLRIQGNKESLEKFLLACRWKGAKGRSQSFSYPLVQRKDKKNGATIGVSQIGEQSGTQILIPFVSVKIGQLCI
jgi:hypothetical protein